MLQTQVNTATAASDALQLRRQREQVVFLTVAASESSPTPKRSGDLGAVTATPTAVTAAATTTSVDWPCVAVAETGGDVTMHGATYSTMYGVVNDIVEDYASPEVQAKVFAGTASESEQTDIVARFAADHGTGGWGVLTKQKCHL